MEVNLWTVESAIALVDNVLNAHRLKCITQALLSALPVLVRTHRILWARRKLNAVWEAKLCIVCGNEVRCIRDLLSNLIRADKEVCVVLSKLTNTEQTVQSTLHLITVIKTSLSQLHRKIPIRTWLRLVNQACTRAVHRLNCKVLFIYRGGVHILFVVVPVTRGLPKGTREDQWGLNLLITKVSLHLMPVIGQSVAQSHAVWKPERRAWAKVGHHEELHLTTNLPVVALLGFFNHLEVLSKLLFRTKCHTINSGEHLVVLIGLPIGARDAGQLEGLNTLGVKHVRTNTHVNIFALLVEGDVCVRSKIANVLNLIRLAALLHVSNSLIARKLKRLNLEVLFDDLLHLSLNCWEIVLVNLGVSKINVIVETVFGCWTIGKLCVRIQTLQSLSKQMSCIVTNNLKLFSWIVNLANMAVVI